MANLIMRDLITAKQRLRDKKDLWIKIAVILVGLIPSAIFAYLIILENKGVM